MASNGYTAYRENLRTSAPQLSLDQLTTARIPAYEGYAAAQIKLPPYNPDLLITSKQYKLFEDMMDDPAVRAPLQIKKTAVLYKGIDLVPAITDEKDPLWDQAKMIRDHCKWVVENIRTDWGCEQSLEDAVFELLDGTHTGFKVAEIIYRVLEDGPYQGKWGLSAIVAKPCKQIGFNLDPMTFRPLSITSYTPLGGFDLDIPVEKVIHYKHMPKDGEPWGSPDGRASYPHWWRRNLFHKVWAIAIESFGAPFIMAHAPGDGKRVSDIIKKIRQGAPAVLPQNVEADLTELTGGGVTAIQKACEYDMHMIAYNVLFQTLTTSEGDRVGSMALGSVHQDTQEYGLGWTRKQVAADIKNQLLKRIVRYNFGEEFVDLTPTPFLGIWDQTDRLKYAQAVSALIDRQVVDRTEPVVREQFGFPPMTKEVAALLETEHAKAQKPMPVAGGPQNGE